MYIIDLIKYLADIKVTCLRKFFKSSNFLLDNYEAHALRMVNEMDRNGRTPLIIAEEVASKELVHKITKCHQK